MKIGAIVITYHPDIFLLEKNIEAFSESVDEIIIWKNSSEDLSFIEHRYQNVVILGDGSNHFIAEPLNIALEYFQNRGYDYLLTMDQDSVFVDFEAFIENVDRYADDNIAIYAPNPGNLSLENDYACFVESVITSGSLINLVAAKRIGSFRENFQIYWVDGEYCYWTRKQGYKILVFPKCKLVQRFGRETKTLFGFTTSNYSATVYYYLIRNMLWMKREFRDSVSMKCVLYTLLYNVRGIILGENNKIKKLASIARAIIHGLFMKIEERP